jgi:SprB repeat
MKPLAAKVVLFLFLFQHALFGQTPLHIFPQKYTSTSFTVFNVNTSCYGGGGVKMFINNVEIPDFNYGYCDSGICQFRFPFGQLKVGDIINIKDGCGNKSADYVVKDDYVYVEVPNGGSYTGNGIGPLDETLPYSKLSTPVQVGKCEPVEINAHTLHGVQLLVGSPSTKTTGIYKINGSPIQASQFVVDAFGNPASSFVFNPNGSITANGVADLYTTSSYSGRTPFSIEYTHANNGTGHEFFVGPLSLLFRSDFQSLELREFKFDGSIESTTLTQDFRTSKFLFTFNQGTFKLFIDNVERKAVQRSVVYSASSGTISNGGLLPYGTKVTWTPGASGRQWVQAVMDGLRVVRQYFDVAADMTINQTVTDVGCSGGGNGSVSLNVTGGKAPLQYSKDNVSFGTNPTFGALAAGTYTFYVKDASGCQTQKNITVNQNAVLTLSGNITQAVNCAGGTNGQVTLNASGGAGFYQYARDGGAYSSSNTISGLSTGSQVFKVRDAAGCEKSISLTLTATSQIVASATESPVKCFGENTGSLTVNTTGSTIAGALNYSKDGVNFQSSPVFSNLGANVYTLTIKDNLCSVVLNNQGVSQPNALAANLSLKRNALCFGSNTGQLNLNISGGFGSYAYSLDASTYTAMGSGGAVIDNLPMGNYKVWVKDQNACATSTSIVSIGQPSVLQASVASQVNVACYSESTGSVKLAALGGTPTYSYKITGGGTQTSETFNGLPTGPNSFTVIDQNGCSANVSTTLSQPAAPFTVALINATSLTCHADLSGRLSLNTTGGTGPYQLKLNNGLYENTTVFNNLSAGSYTVYGKDANQCPFTLSGLSLSQPTPIAITMLNKKDVNCISYERGEATLFATGSNGTFSYTLSGKDFQFNSITQVNNTSGTFKNLKAGDYLLVATDIKGCKKEHTVTIIPKRTEINFETTTTLPSNCLAQDGKIQIINPNGGRPPYQYGISTASSFGSSPIFSNLLNGQYIVTVSDSLCSYKKSVDLLLPGSLRGEAVVDPISCNASDANLRIQGITGGNGNYQLAINGGPFSAQTTFLALSPNVYSVVIKDTPQSCQSVLSVEIKEQNRADLQVTQIKNIECFGFTTGSITIQGNNNVGSFSYALEKGSFGGSGTFNGLRAIEYTLRAMNRLGCQDSIKVLLTEPPLLESQIHTKDNLCFGDKTGEINVAGYGGVGPYTYTLNQGAEQTNHDFKQLIAGPYEMRVKDKNGCVLSKPVVLKQPPKLELRPIYQDTIRCFGEQNGAVRIEPTGGTPGYMFSKDSLSFFQNPVFDQLKAGTYTFYITDKNACANQAKLEVTQPELLTLSLLNKTNPLCVGEANGRVTLISTGGNGRNTYIKDNVFKQTHPLFENLSQGDFSFRVEDRKGCLDTVTLVRLTWPKALAAEVLTQSPVCFGDANAQVKLEVAGGVGDYSAFFKNGVYQPNPGTRFSFSDLEAGHHDFVVKDANGCQLEVPVSIPNAVKLNPNIALGGDLRTADSVVVCKGQEVELDAKHEGQQITWYKDLQILTSLQNQNQITVKEAGTYEVTIKNNTGCEVKDVFVLKHNPKVLITDFLISTQAILGDTIVILDKTFPQPDFNKWIIPDNIVVVQENKAFIRLIFDNENQFKIGLKAQLDDCIISKFYTIEIVDKENIANANPMLGFLGENLIEKLSVSPNPNYGSFAVDYILKYPLQASILLVHAQTGKSIYQKTLDKTDKGSFEISIHNFVPGVYNLILSTANKSESIKIVLMK